MALTKVTGQVIKNTTDVTVGVLTVTNTLAVGGTVSIGGTLTYEDVTNVDAVGLVTARNGIVVGSGITLSKDGDGFFTGIVTATSFAGDGANLTGVASTDNIRTNTNATFLQNINVSGSTTTGSLVSSGAISGTTGTFTGDVDIASSLVHTGDTDTKISFASNTIKFDTDTSERLRINSTGQLLINTTDGTGAYQLVVASPSGSDTGMTFRGATASQQRIRFADGTSGGAESIGQVEYNHADNSLAIDTNGAEAVRIDSSGRLLTGGATSSHGSSNADDLQIGANNQGNQTGITLGSTSASSIRFADASDDTAGQIYYSHGDDTMRFTAGSSERVRIDANGIKFNGDSAAANALDDYEEGNYTPNIQTDNNVTAGTSGTQYGHYVKIGNIVFVTVKVNINSFSGVNTSAYIRIHLPFTARNTYGVEGNMFMSEWSIGSQNISWMAAEVQNNFNFAYLHYHNGSNNNTNYMTGANANGSISFKATAVYVTA